MFAVALLVLYANQACAFFSSPVDIGYEFNAETLYWPGVTPTSFNLTPTRQETPYWFATNALTASEHGGTHLDAPYHFNKEGWKVADIPLEKFLVEGVMIDMAEKAAENPDFNITAEDLIEWEEYYGPLPDQVVILVNFGWGSKYPNRTAYFGSNSSSDLHFPGVSESAAKWIVNTGKVVGVGVDAASIDPGVNIDFISHRILSAANIYLLENVALSKANLPPRNFQLVVMPMKITEGTGAPLRLIAYPNKASSSLLNQLLSWARSVFRNLF